MAKPFPNNHARNEFQKNEFPQLKGLYGDGNEIYVNSRRVDRQA